MDWRFGDVVVRRFDSSTPFVVLGVADHEFIARDLEINEPGCDSSMLVLKNRVVIMALGGLRTPGFVENAEPDIILRKED